MRTTFDRIRHAISFEIIGLVLVTLLGMLFFNMDPAHMGVVALVGATIATGWNYFYNLIFDHAMLRFRGRVQKTPLIRVLHAVLFEAGLLVALLPFIAWYLQVSLWEALMLDIVMAIFYLFYAFVFNWAYDLIFPLPEVKAAESKANEAAEV